MTDQGLVSHELIHIVQQHGGAGGMLSQALLLRCANAEYKNMGKLPLSGLTRPRA
jgi:hypothetical protein